MPDLLIHGARIVAFRPMAELAAQMRSEAGATGARWVAAAQRAAAPQPPPVDLRVSNGKVVHVGDNLDPGDADQVDARGLWVIPGLWDAHAHLDLEAARMARLDTSGVSSADELLGLVADHLMRYREQVGSDPPSIQGFGHRPSRWPVMPTIAQLDEVTGVIPTVLISGDVHSGWVNSAALQALGAQVPEEPTRTGPLSENQWFDAMGRLDQVPGSEDLRESGYRAVFDAALGRGIVGIVDMARPRSVDDWGQRAQRLPGPWPRIRAAIYAEHLDKWAAKGLCTGSPLPGTPHDAAGLPLVTQGPLKVITDGSMGSLTAWTLQPYLTPEGPTTGVSSISPADLAQLMGRATSEGFTLAVHAIGDAALVDALEAFRASGASGRVEHLQLRPTENDCAAPAAREAFQALARAGVAGSVQPAHLLDDSVSVRQVWPGWNGSPVHICRHDGIRAGASLGVRRSCRAFGSLAGHGRCR